MVVYLDGVIGLNFLVDLMLLLGVNRLAGFPTGLGRATAAAMVGSGYAGACLVPGLRFLSSNVWRIVSLVLVTMTAFGLDVSAFRRGILFVLLSMALGGLVLSFDTGNFWGLVLCAVILSLLCTMGFRGKVFGKQLVNVSLIHNGSTHRFRALVDTGNCLRDPVTGEQVMVLGADLSKNIFQFSNEMLADPVTVLVNGAGTRLIPYHAVGGGGILAAMRCEGLYVDGKKMGGLVAFSPQNFPDGEYQALTGGIYG